MAFPDHAPRTGNGGSPQQEELRGESIAQLLKQLSEQTSNLVKQEFELAKAELTVKGKQAGIGAGLLGGGGIAALFALGAFTTAVIAALATGMPTWLAALIVAAVYGVVAAVLAMTGKNRVAEATPPAPQTIETLKEDASWAKNQKRSGSK